MSFLLNDSNKTTGNDRAEVVLTDEQSGDYADINVKPERDVNGLETIPSVPAYSNLKYDEITSDINLNGGFTTIFSNNSSGLISGFKLICDNDNVTVRLVVDGANVFSVSLDTLNNFSIARNTNSGLIRFLSHDSIGEIEFFPNFPIRYNTSFEVQAREDSGNREVEQGYIFYTESL